MSMLHFWLNFTWKEVGLPITLVIVEHLVSLTSSSSFLEYFIPLVVKLRAVPTFIHVEFDPKPGNLVGLDLLFFCLFLVPFFFSSVHGDHL